MLNFLTWLGLGVFTLTLSFDIWSEWLAPRLLSRDWFPGEPNLPSVAGDVDEPTQENKHNVMLAGYFAGGGILIIGLLDISPVQPNCLPYSNFIKTYGIAVLSAATGFMWFSEGQNVVAPFHKGIRYIVGVMTVLIPLYMAACGEGVL